MLDVEWVNHAQRVLDINDALADAQHAMEIASDAVDIEKAKADARIRKTEKYDTEKALSVAVQRDKTYIAAKDRVLSLRLKVLKLQSASRALEHRKKALEKLTELFHANYFAGPSEPRDLGSEARKYNEITRSIARERIKRTMAKSRRTR
jgi:hypothetical protein